MLKIMAILIRKRPRPFRMLAAPPLFRLMVPAVQQKIDRFVRIALTARRQNDRPLRKPDRREAKVLRNEHIPRANMVRDVQIRRLIRPVHLHDSNAGFFRQTMIERSDHQYADGERSGDGYDLLLHGTSIGIYNDLVIRLMDEESPAFIKIYRNIIYDEDLKNPACRCEELTAIDDLLLPPPLSLPDELGEIGESLQIGRNAGQRCQTVRAYRFDLVHDHDMVEIFGNRLLQTA